MSETGRTDETSAFRWTDVVCAECGHFHTFGPCDLVNDGCPCAELAWRWR